MVENRGKKTSFKTMGKSGWKKVFFQDKEHEVGKANSFKTIEDTNNKSISFKTFNNWVKARTVNCDTALKDALSFVSDMKSAVDGEKTHNEQDMHDQRDPIPSTQSQTASGQTAQATPSSQGRLPWTEERSPWSPAEESLPWSPRKHSHAAKAEAEKPQVKQYNTVQNGQDSWNHGNEQCSNTN